MSEHEPVPRQRVLLVEDNRSQGDALVIILGSGFDVVRAIDGRAARALLARDDRFDVILSDVLMPRMTGFALLQWVRSTAPHLEHRFLFLTVDLATPVARALTQTHAVLRKPVNQRELHAAIHALVGRR